MEAKDTVTYEFIQSCEGKLIEHLNEAEFYINPITSSFLWMERVIEDITVPMAEISFKAGMEKVVAWVTNREKHYSNPHFKFDKEWQVFLKENDLKAHQ